MRAWRASAAPMGGGAAYQHEAADVLIDAGALAQKLRLLRFVEHRRPSFGMLLLGALQLAGEPTNRLRHFLVALQLGRVQIGSHLATFAHGGHVITAGEHLDHILQHVLDLRVLVVARERRLDSSGHGRDGCVTSQKGGAVNDNMYKERQAHLCFGPLSAATLCRLRSIARPAWCESE